ncbi:YhdP family protein [Cupriavidus basilensis]|uniref:YhdP family protein n=1 Tax=Cupriavidus basilensis TaxID=68895 RepID=A0ABT6B2N8_9BURK|nr:YhdP family protein [Cupriavidus basilensis]MDF3839149.1 YhdP family protein [Cupriavidus basilensis]
MSSRATPPAESTTATAGGTPGHEGSAGPGTSPWRQAARLARAPGRALLAALRHPMWRGLGRVLIRLALALLMVALLAGLLIRFVLWPQASAARTWLEQRGSVALAAHFSIGQLDTYWDGWHPAFHARDVKAVDTEQRVLLAAGSLDGRLSWRSLFSMDLLFQHISARQTDLLVRRSADGKLQVAGLAVDTTGARPQDNRLFDWLLAQGKVELSDGKLRWLDDRNRLPQLDVGNIQFSARRLGTRHIVKLEAQSATLAPRPLSMQADFRHEYLHSAGDWHNWHGQASWDLGRLELPVLQRYTAIFDRVARGTFSTDGTIEFRGGQVTRSQARLRASDVDLQLAGAPEPLKLASAQAFVMHRAGRDRDNVLTIDTLLWQPEPAEGPAASAPPAASPASQAAAESGWREGMRKVVVGWATDNKGALRKFSLKAPTFDLNTVRALAMSLPLDTALSRQLRALQPAGHVDNLDVSWTRDRQGLLSRHEGQPHFNVQGTLRNVSVREQPASPPLAANGKPHLGVPGFSRISGSFSLDERQGSARFEGSNAALVLPGMFEDPRLTFDQISGELRWTHDDGKLSVRTDGVRFANADTAGTVRGTWHAGGDGHGGIADLSGELERAQVSRVPRYLPMGMPAATRQYLAGALVAGEASGVKFLLKGDLEHFPFHSPHEKAGDFRVEVPIQHVSYQIAPHESAAPGSIASANNGGKAWPNFTDISGHLLFERGSLSFVAQRAGVQGIAGVTLQDVNGRIADLSDHGRLILDGSASGAMTGFLRFVAASPVRDWTGQVTSDARAQGNGELRLKLDLPLTETHAAKVDGQFRLPGNDVVLTPQLPVLAGTTGAIAFNEHGFQLNDLRARFMGGEIRASGGSQADGTVRVNAGGSATAQGIREAISGSPMAGLAQKLEGSTAYSAVIGVRDHQPQITVASELAGLAVGLPAPLAKSAAQAVPLRFDLRPAAARAGSDEMLVQYGNVLNARYLLRRNADGVEVQSGGIGIEQPAPQPGSGVAAALTATRFDLDAWRGLFAESGKAGSAAAVSPFTPEKISAHVHTLQAFGREFDEVVLEASRETGGWGVQLDTRQIAGNVRWREDAATPAGALTLRLSRLNIPDSSDAGNIEDALAANTGELPALDLVADRFQLHGRDFGKLEVKAHASANGGEPVWTLERLLIEQPGATFTGSGSWRMPRRLREGASAERRTLLDFKLDVRNGGQVLERMGLPHMLADGRGTLEGRVAWRGSPLAIDYPTLSGRMKLKLENGQILSVDPGAAKLLGVLSLQGLMRLATFDFRGVAGQGMPFDEITGTGTIDKGVASTGDFELRGGQLRAAMTGSANIPRETQDLEVTVVPRINATSASVAAAFINPALGIGTLAAQLMFADEFSKAFSRRYHISGGWANPQITKVGENKADSAPVQGSSGRVYPVP